PYSTLFRSDGLGPMQSGQIKGAVPGMIPGSRIELFVGVFMLFVHDDQAQLLERKKKRGAGTHHQAACSLGYLFPDLAPLVIVEPGMVYGQLISEPGP